MEINISQIIATLINFAILGGFIGGIVFLFKRLNKSYRSQKAIEEKLDRVLEVLEKEKKN